MESHITSEIIKEVKEFINKNNLECLKELWTEYQTTDFESYQQVSWDYIFQKVYLHACLKKRRDIVEWLDTLFIGFNEITQIAIRHTLNYGKYLLNK